MENLNYWIIGIGILLIVVVFLANILSASTNTQKSNPSLNFKSVIKWVSRILLIVFLGWLIYWWFFSKKTENNDTDTTPKQTVVNGYLKTAYLLPFQGALEVNVENTDRLFTYPQGGPVHIIPPSGRDYIDTPGIKKIYPPESAGTFKFEIPAGSTATGIEIWQ